MRRNRLLITFIVLVGLTLAGVAGTTGYLLKMEPQFYVDCAVPEGKERKKMSAAFLGIFSQLASHIADYSREPWQVTFSQNQINSYFAEDFIRLGDAAHLQQQGISEPRVVFEKDRMRLAFRYGSSFWSTVFSFDVRTWLAPEEQNVIAIEFLARNAGSMPISAKSFLDQISNLARRNKIEIVWFRHNGNPVALLHLTTGRERPGAQLQHLKVENGKLTIGGLSFEPGQHLTETAAFIEEPAEMEKTTPMEERKKTPSPPSSNP